MPEGMTLRPYQEGDERKLVDLFEDVFHKKRSLAHWTWKFKENPYLPPAVYLAEGAAGEIVAQIAGIPIKLNFHGEPVLAVLAVDASARPELQGRGVVFKLANKYQGDLIVKGVRAIVAPPNPKSYRPAIRVFGCRRITFFKEYAARFSIRKQARNIFRLGPLAGLVDFVYRILVRIRLHVSKAHLANRLPNVVLCRSTKLPEGYGVLWNNVKVYEVLSIWKDSEYFRWRYDCNPDRRFEYFSVAMDGRLVALAVVAAEGLEKALICELIVEGRNVLLARFLIKAIQCRYAGLGHTALRFLGHEGAGFFDQVFDGFRQSTAFPWVGKVIAEHEDLKALFLQPTNWTLTYGDIDLI